ncbi:hypothetical protein X777_08311 [Ooceraea biroi]|uniref:Uncharacterized protein n=1 Tax=Ooceraea biroi TaxID=2015173 RepID=A0A026X168_OOCBI|nr:hypothetical protein X777_08311 [Ooceraea biroi]
MQQAWINPRLISMPKRGEFLTRSCYFCDFRLRSPGDAVRDLSEHQTTVPGFSQRRYSPEENAFTIS